MALGKKFLQHVLPGVVKPIHTLWNEVIGFLFFALAVMAVPSAYRNIRHFDGEPKSFFRVMLSGTFAVLMLWFGVSSFLRARRISRS